ncbi:hypothetical protein J8273_5646 [Carpediemonas membranifera]|uniref:RNA-directed DNA polymerase n=1 Tax=Carpediemonas membranifera TaxID=201153 RepID=A0A8J6AVZ7_9EUKA|nr:hypothetical protein J8273_5646 [Carpediemonas membranifera]|eukprot:KAG9392940.1 hypothetical protein J8273_5646 [Carpediemonas membranifera]
MTIPELDAINLDRESVRSFKRQVQRLKVFAPDAKASLFLTDALSDLIQRQFDLNAETITEEELFKHLDKLVGPQTSRQWLAELSKVRCESTITDLNTRTVLVRKYINAFQDIFQLYTKGTFSEEENLSRDDDTVIEKATKLCLSHLAPDAFQRVVRTEYDLRKPTKLEDVYKLITEAARVEDQLRLDMTRYGYDLVRTKKARTKANSDPDTDESSSTKQALPIKAKEAAPTSKPRPNDIHPTNRPPKTPCPICQGNHWRNECPRSEKTRSRESGGGLRAKSELKAKTPFEAMILDDAEIDTEDDVLKTTGHINGQEYVFHIDSCARRSGVSEGLAKDLALPHSTGPTRHYLLADQSVATANGRTSADLRVALAGHETRFTANLDIIPGKTPLILIGCDILRSLGCLTSDGLFVKLVKETAADEGDDIPFRPAEELLLADDVQPNIEIEELKQPITAILVQHPHVFDGLAPGGAKVPAMRIPLVDEQHLVQAKPRRLNPRRREQVREELQRLRSAGITRASQGPFASPIVVVDKASGAIRLCIDYTALNRITVKDHFPLPDLKSFVREASGSRFFAALDLTSGYHQVPVHPDDVRKTAMITPDAYDEFVRVPFGLANAPSHFQRVMQGVLAPVLHKGVMVYIDDILIHAKTQEEFLQTLEHTLVLLDRHDLRLNLAKCKFASRKVKVVGFDISEQGRSVDPERAKALNDITSPTSVKDMRRIAGMFNYIAEHLPRAQELLGPLYDAIKAEEWGDPQEQALQSLKEATAEAITLTQPDPGLPWHLYTDASDNAVGGILYQIAADGQHHPVTLFSKRLTDVQRRWCTYDKELYGILSALTRSDMQPLFTMATDLHVHTDHRNIVYLMKRSDCSPKVMRWRITLQQFPAEISHVAGEDNAVADALSRCCFLTTDDIPEDARAILRTLHGGSAGHPSALDT